MERLVLNWRSLCHGCYYSLRLGWLRAEVKRIEDRAFSVLPLLFSFSALFPSSPPPLPTACFSFLPCTSLPPSPPFTSLSPSFPLRYSPPLFPLNSPLSQLLPILFVFWQVYLARSRVYMWSVTSLDLWCFMACGSLPAIAEYPMYTWALWQITSISFVEN